MTDEEMVAYLARCQLDPAMPRAVDRDASARVRAAPARRPHASRLDRRDRGLGRRRAARRGVLRRRRGVDPVHPAGLRALEAGRGGRRARIRRRRSSSWRSTASSPGARRAEESYASTLDAINRAAAFVAERGRRRAAFGGRRVEPLGDASRHELLASVLPALRGAVSVDGPRILQVDTSPEVLEFACGEGSPDLSQVGAACPDHLVHTRRRAAWVEFDPAAEGADVLKERVVQRVAEWRERELEYFERYRERRPAQRPEPAGGRDRGSRARLGRAHAEGCRGLHATSITARSTSCARPPRSAVSSRSTTRSPSRSSTGRSSSTSCPSRPRRASCRERLR